MLLQYQIQHRTNHLHYMNSIDIFPWNDSFNTEITLIDEQHRKLADLINLLASHVAFNANIPSLNVIFDELAEYAVYHFDTEEKIWHEYMPEDSFETDHIKVHSSFLNEVLRLKTEEETKPVSKVIEDILAFLTRWLAAHILESDRAMAMVVIAMQSGMPLEAAKKHASEQMRGATKVLIDIILSIYESLSTNTLHLMRELAEQKRMQMLLNDQERHFEVLLSTTPVGIFESDINGKCVYVNAQWSKITGLSIENAKGDGWVKALHPEDKDKIFTEWTTSTAENRPFHLEYRFLHPNGKTIWVLGKSAIYKSQLNNQYGYVGTITDISELKQLETSKQESLAILQKIANQVPGVVYQYRLHPDGHASFPFASDGIRTIYRVSPEEVREDAAKVWAILHPDDLEGIVNSIEKSAQELTLWNHEYRVKFDDNTVRWLLGSAKPERETDGSVLWHGFITDITERKKSEEALKDSEFRWKFAIEGSGDGVWDWNIQTDEAQYSKGWKEMLGYSDEDILPTNDEWSSRVHPDDQLYVKNAMQAYLEGMTDIYVVEYRLRCKDDSYKWILGRGMIVCRSEDGKPLRMIGTHTDISERKHLELELTRQAHLDYLTGLSNRRHFMEQAEVEMSRAIRYDTPLSLLMLDIDFFKNVNDTYGHQVGDIVLQALSKICQDTLRQVDVAGRIGGEEFAVILPQATSAEALEVAERLREAVANTDVTIPVGLPIHFTVSIGVTTLGNKGINIDTLLNQADKALYKAKETGRNKVCVV